MPKPRSKLLYIAIVAAAVVALLVLLSREAVEFKDIGTGLLALVGTITGATLAFRLNESREREREDANRRTALNAALFLLARQWNALRQLERDLAPYKTPFDRAFNLPALKPPPYTELHIRFESLDFMLASEHVNVLLRLSVEQERFHQTIASLDVRNDFYVTELQPALASLKLNGKSLTLAESQTVLGERLFGTSMSSAETFYMHLTSTLTSLREMHAELRGVAKALYPEHKFVQFSEDA